jgi:DNA-binding transcriptional LysR family regulator
MTMMRRLEMIVAIDTHRSFHRAARALGISQPSLTRALQVLEGELGVRLFERGKADCEPTEYGLVMLNRSRRILTEMAEAKREIALLQGLEVGEFRIGAGSFATQLWLGAAIGQLSAAHPRLKVHSTERPWYHLSDALMASEIDVAVGESSELSNSPEVVVSRLPRRRGVFLCRAGHSLLQRTPLSINDIAKFPLAAPVMPRRIAAHLPAGSAMGSLVNGGLSFEPAIFCESLVGIGDLVESSDALGIVPLAAVKRMQQRPGIAVLPFEAPWLCTEQALMWRRDRMPHPALKTFRDAVRRCEAAAMNGKPPTNDAV